MGGKDQNTLEQILELEPNFFGPDAMYQDRGPSLKLDNWKTAQWRDVPGLRSFTRIGQLGTAQWHDTVKSYL